MLRRWLFGAVFLGITGCGGEAILPQTELSPGTEEDAISSSSPAYVTLRHDMRRCLAPLCGGFYIKDVNRNRAEVYVSGLDFSQSGLDEATIQVAQEAGDLVIRGKLSAKEPRFQTRALIVLDAYRGLTGPTRQASDTFYGVTVNDPPIQCITAPCNNDVATPLNRGNARGFTSVDPAAMLPSFVDPNFLIARVEHHGAILAGHFEDGPVLGVGRASLLVPSQIYLKLPDVDAACPQARTPPCPDGQVQGFERNAERCVLPTMCVSTRACTRLLPTCADGYVSTRWTGPDGCPAVTCDPVFSMSATPRPSRCLTVRCTAATHCVEDGPIACVPNLTCADIQCGPDTHCLDAGGQDASCVADVWTPETVSVESAHPYRNRQNQAWIYTSEVSGATGVRIHFSSFDLEDGYDFVIIQGTDGTELGRYTGTLGDFTTPSFAGSSVRIVFQTDSSVTAAGFAIDRVDSRSN
ncbi:MAG: CUB domain-containing protein [Myxococcota bacterium]